MPVDSSTGRISREKAESKKDERVGTNCIGASTSAVNSQPSNSQPSNSQPSNSQASVTSQNGSSDNRTAHGIIGSSIPSITDCEFSAKQVQIVLRKLIDNSPLSSDDLGNIESGSEKVGLALLNYYARTNLVPCTGKQKIRGRKKYAYSDVVLLCWLFRMKREGLPVNRFRRGIDYLRKKLPKLHRDPVDMVMLTDGRQLFIKHRIEEKGQIAEVLTGKKAGQYVWAYAIGSLIEEIDEIITNEKLLSSDENSYQRKGSSSLKLNSRQEAA